MSVAGIRAASARWRAKNPNYAKRYYHKHRKEILARERRRFASRLKTRRNYLRKWNARRRRALLRGHTHCPICLKRLKKGYVDHCHRTAKRLCKHVPYKACKRCQRDVICQSCNSVLGMIAESFAILTRLRKYLKKWNRIHGRK